MQLNKKSMLILTVVAALALVGLLAISFIPQKKNGQADDGVTQTITDGIAQEMADSKSDAYRGLTSTDDYFEQLGARMEADEDISLVSSSGSAAPAAAAGTGPAAGSGESSVDRVFGAPPASSSSPAATSSNHRSSGGVGASRPMTSDERLDYERRRAEMVRDVLTGGAAEETPAEEPKQEPCLSTFRLWAPPTALSLHSMMTSMTRRYNMKVPSGPSVACSCGTRRLPAANG